MREQFLIASFAGPLVYCNSLVNRIWSSLTLLWMHSSKIAKNDWYSSGFPENTSISALGKVRTLNISAADNDATESVWSSSSWSLSTDDPRDFNQFLASVMPWIYLVFTSRNHASLAMHDTSSVRALWYWSWAASKLSKADYTDVSRLRTPPSSSSATSRASVARWRVTADFQFRRAIEGVVAGSSPGGDMMTKSAGA